MNVPLNATIEAMAKQRLNENGSYARCFRGISFKFESGVLTIRGTLPSFYMKQILQHLLRDLEGVELLNNQAEVISATGLSSVRKPR